MTFVQAYTVYFLQGSELFVSFRTLGSSGNKQFRFILITIHKQSLRRLCFYTCLSVHRWGLGPCQGVSRPMPRRVSAQGVSRPMPRGMFAQWGCPGPGPRPGGVSQHALRQTPPQQTVTAADGMHPTGMHSC